jgi:hypothetical protein
VADEVARRFSRPDPEQLLKEGTRMTGPSSLEWIFGRFLAAKMLGGRRRRRALRWALTRMVERTASQRDRAATPADAAFHHGAHVVYAASLCALDDVEHPRDEPPNDQSLRDAWQRGREEAIRHSEEMYQQIMGQPLPS